MDRCVEISSPVEIAGDLRVLFPDYFERTASATSSVRVEREADGLFAVDDGIGPLTRGLARDDVAAAVMEVVVAALVRDLVSAVALHAGAVASGGQALLIAGPSGSGKSSLVAWLVNKGFDYLSDEVVVLPEAGGGIRGFRRALVFKPGAKERVYRFSSFEKAARIRSGANAMLSAPKSASADARGPADCRLMIFPRFQAGAALRLQSLSPAKAGLRLVECNVNARNFADDGFGAVSRLARTVPAMSLVYGDFDQLEGVLDALARAVVASAGDGDAVRAVLEPFLVMASPPVVGVPEPEARRKRLREPKKLTIGRAVYDDYDGVYFTLQSLRLHHPEAIAQVEFVLIDNNPDGSCGPALRELGARVPGVHYVPCEARSGTAVRDVIFEEAVGEFVLCMDCHVLLAPGALARLLDYIGAEPETNDLLQGPMLRDDLAHMSTHWSTTWRHGMYGHWDTDARAADAAGAPFEIQLQGLGLFACRRAAWPGLNRNFRGFGGEEGYLHEKFRRRGGRVLCLPFLRWLHRFGRPSGVPYVNTWDDRIRNYMIGHTELGWPTIDLETHFRELLGDMKANSIFEDIRNELEAEASAKARRAAE
jgi:hypothetical protein